MKSGNICTAKHEAALALWLPRKEEMEYLYHDQKWSMTKIGGYFGVRGSCIMHVFRRIGIASRGKARSGKENGRYLHGKAARQYRQMIVKDKCASCGKTEGLLIHHVNGDHYDNRLDNLKILCSPCHTTHHKKLWWEKTNAEKS